MLFPLLSPPLFKRRVNRRLPPFRLAVLKPFPP
jgi:hypothetical protein